MKTISCATSALLFLAILADVTQRFRQQHACPVGPDSEPLSNGFSNSCVKRDTSKGFTGGLRGLKSSALCEQLVDRARCSLILAGPLHSGMVLEDLCRLLGSHMLQAEHVVNDALHVTADGRRPHRSCLSLAR